MNILMAARPFRPLSIVPIIVWTVKRASTPTIGEIILVKANVVVPVGALIVQIMCVAPTPPSIAPYVIVSFTELNANIIMR